MLISQFRLKRQFLFSWISLLILCWAGCSPTPQVKWEPFHEQALAEAVRSGQPSLVFFSAAWCPTCYHMKEQTFSNERVIQALEAFRRFKADMSYRHSEKTQAMGNQYQIRGFPTVLFFDPSGKEIYRMEGFAGPDEFLKILNRIMAPSVSSAPDSQSTGHQPLPTDA